MKKIKLNEETKSQILENLLKRSPSQYTQYEQTVNDIISNVRENGNKALFEYTEKFDGYKLTPDNILVTRAEIDEAYSRLDKELIDVLKEAAENIRSFHLKQLRNSWFDAGEDGTILGMKITKSGGICSRRKSRLSQQRVDECYTCQSGRCK